MVLSFVLVVVSVARFATRCLFEKLVGSFASENTINPQTRRRARVAVIGGGIAGCGAAWTLAESGFEVHLFEKQHQVGGNAKRFKWSDSVVTGLSVLAWPKGLFHNYESLMNLLNIEQVNVDLPFTIRNADKKDYVTGDPTCELAMVYAVDIHRWKRMIWTIRCINAVFNRFAAPSLYNMSMLNPLNLFPLKWASKLFGISQQFWDDIIVPLYASTFLTVDLDTVPSVILPLISDIVPLTQTPSMRSWATDSGAVFDRMLKGVIVHCDTPVNSVTHHSESHTWSVNETYREFDRVVFASNAQHVAHCNKDLPPSLGHFFNGIRYTQQDRSDFMIGVIHKDATIFPETKRAELLSKQANFIEATRLADGTVEHTNTFILSGWYPSVPSDSKATFPRLVTYNPQANLQPDPTKVVGKVENEWNHPVLSSTNLLRSYLLRLVQGRHGSYYCGSFATPGNGHDLSFSSGVAIACTIGAEYPFRHNKAALDDIIKLSNLLGVAGPPPVASTTAMANTKGK
eukprot:m.63643 g.63643  ORF g.63643 m.63643 type:complete len:515 (+) comp23317_c0_seq1:164-1708(+)